MKSTMATRVQLVSPEEQSRRISFDFNSITLNTKITTIQSSRSSTNPDRGRGLRFSSVSSSYALFLKQRDTDKNKKVVSEEINQMEISIR